MRKKYFNLFTLFLIGVFLLTAGFGCKSPGQEVQKHLKPTELNYWRVFDDEDAFAEIITQYRQSHPNIKINYRKFRYDEYEKALLDALAEDRGPDIISIHESWLRKYQTKLQPMPSEITMAYQIVKGTLKKEVTYELKTKPALNLRQLKENFADTVYQDAVIDSQIFGLPLSLETLVMFYNKDILNRAGVAQAPNTWKSFQEAVEKMTRFDSQGKIIQSGAALGAGDNVERAFDILSILMMQNGATMTDNSGSATFTKSRDNNYNPGVEAIKFYADFASPVKNVYSWNSEMTNSLDAFIAGKVGIIFGYNYHLPAIRARAPRLNLGIAPIPQVTPDAPINYAGYWLETVSNKSSHPNEAWDFIIFASQKEQVKTYLEKTKRPTALKAVINEQLENEDIYPAATQTLTAANWYQGKDPLAAENAIKEMIDKALTAATDKELKSILDTAIQKINQTIK